MDRYAALYRINDVLTVLAQELGIRFLNDEDEDASLQDATLAVAEAFGISFDNLGPSR